MDYKYKKVIILTGFYFPSIGGMEKRLDKWSQVLIKNNVKVEIFTTAMFSRVEDEIYKKVHIIRKGINFREWSGKALEYIKEKSDENTVVLVAALGHDMDANMLLCAIEAHKLGSKIVMSVPTADHITRALARKEGANEFLNNVDRLITVSDDAKIFSKYCSDVVYIQNFIMDNELVSLSSPYPSKNNIAFFGRIAERKRPEILVDIAKLLPSNISLIVQGPAGYGEGKLYNMITNELHNLGAMVLPPEESPDYKIVESKFFINPSKVEGCSNSLLEAMNRGSIPLVSDIKENRTVLNGLIPLCYDDAHSYIKFIKTIDRAQDIHKIQKAMRMRIHQVYSENIVSKKLLEYLTTFKY